MTPLDHLNQASPEDAATMLLPANGSPVWAERMAAARPFPTPESLLKAHVRLWRTLPPEAWKQAFDSHPRIGQTDAKAATAQSLASSAHEQSAARSSLNQDLEDRLAEANRLYETRFGRIFLIRAAGRTVPEILAELHRRLHNDSAAELAEATEQQCEITALRLTRWLETTPA